MLAVNVSTDIDTSTSQSCPSCSAERSGSERRKLARRDPVCYSSAKREPERRGTKPRYNSELLPT